MSLSKKAYIMSDEPIFSALTGKDPCSAYVGTQSMSGQTIVADCGTGFKRQYDIASHNFSHETCVQNLLWMMGEQNARVACCDCISN